MITPFAYVPPTGVNDIAQFPDEDPQIRAHLQALLDQVKDYINNQNQQLTNNLSGNGYQKLPNGLIIQWGQTGVGAGTVTGLSGNTFSYPITFPNGVFRVFCSLIGTNLDQESTSWYAISSEDTNNTGSAIRYRRNVQSYGSVFNWLAIGY